MTEPEAPTVLQDLADRVDWPDAEAERATRDLLKRFVPVGLGLGRLQDSVVWLAGAQGVCPPTEPQRIRAVLFAGQHGIAGPDVSGQAAYAAARVTSALAGGGVAEVLGEVAGVGVRVINISVSEEVAPGGSPAFAASGSIDSADAMSRADAERSITAGAAVADEEIDGGADLLIAGDVGLGSTIAAATIIAVLTSTEPVKLVLNDGSLPDAVWSRRVAAIRDARARSLHNRHDPLDLLAAAGGPDLGALLGFLLQAAARRTPVLLDGVVVSAAALLARDVAPRTVRWWHAAHRAAGPAHELALERLYLEPALSLDVDTGEGTGALLAVPLLRGAIRAVARLTPPIPEPVIEVDEPQPVDYGEVL